MSNDNEIGLGKEILSYCGKCKMAMGHIIVSMNKAGKVDKCKCSTCSSTHKYRDPEGPAKKPGAKRLSKKAGVAVGVMWNEAVTGAKGEAKPYEMTAEFAQGDVIDHPVFGRGVVQSLIGNNKMKIIFETAEKILVFNRQNQ